MRRWEQPAAACVLQAWGSTTSVQLKTDFFPAAAAGHVQRLELELRARGIAPALQGEGDARLLWAALQVRWAALGPVANLCHRLLLREHTCASATWLLQRSHVVHTDQQAMLTPCHHLAALPLPAAPRPAPPAVSCASCACRRTAS